MTDLFACPYCKGRLLSKDDGLWCSLDKMMFRNEDGIFRLLRSQRQADFEKFISLYSKIRRAEGWGSESEDYYLALPFKDLTKRHIAVWRIRAKNFRILSQLMGQRYGQNKLVVLDLGAGNCWLSRYLSEWGHITVALDINLDEFDGLRAGRVYLEKLNLDFLRAQGEMENLPLLDGRFDLVISSGSFHYVSNPAVALSEVHRILKREGYFIINDSPVYRCHASGEIMVKERIRDYRQRFRLEPIFDSCSYFLVYGEIVNLLKKEGFEPQIIEPWYGIRRFLKLMAAKLRGRREPASFPLIIGGKCQRNLDKPQP